MIRTTPLRAVGALLLALALGAPAVAQDAASTTSQAHAATPDRSVPADDSLNATAWAQTSVEHDMVTREIYRVAREKLLKALHDRHWNALPRDARNPHGTKGLKPAVILDVDETVLDNSVYQARLIRDRHEYNDASFAAWVKEEAGTPIPGALAFTRFAARHGVQVIYLTNRDKSLDQATLDNLRKQGFPVHGKYAFLGLGTYVKGCEQIGSQKSCRRELVGRHYRVLMEFGDQLGDFLTVLSNTPKGRRDAVKPYVGWFGSRWFMLPNPEYGSWLPALFHNVWAQPQEQRRREILRHLHYK